MTHSLDTAVAALGKAELQEWFPVGMEGELSGGRKFRTRLLGVSLVAWMDPGGAIHVASDTSEGRAPVTSPYQARIRFGYVWVCLGTPGRDLFEIPEGDEPDRVIMTGGSFGVRAPALRMIENFLDMAHFPYVHAGLLGAEPFTAVRDYEAEITTNDEVLVTGCGFYQPQASLNAHEGATVDYTYRVARPTCAMLYKTAATQPHRRDVLALFLQPVTEEQTVAHFWRALLDVDPDKPETRSFQQQIFAQDRPILENQLPRRLPLNPREERHVRSDLASGVYRRWLRGSGFTFGAISAKEHADAK